MNRKTAKAALAVNLLIVLMEIAGICMGFSNGAKMLVYYTVLSNLFALAACGETPKEAEKTDIFEEHEAPVIDEAMHYSYTGNGKKIRVYTDVNPRLILGDFFAKMKINFGH